MCGIFLLPHFAAASRRQGEFLPRIGGGQAEFFGQTRDVGARDFDERVAATKRRARIAIVVFHRRGSMGFIGGARGVSSAEIDGFHRRGSKFFIGLRLRGRGAPLALRAPFGV